MKKTGRAVLGQVHGRNRVARSIILARSRCPTWSYHHTAGLSAPRAEMIMLRSTAAVIPAGEDDDLALVLPVSAGIGGSGDALWIPISGGVVAALPAEGGHCIRMPATQQTAGGCHRRGQA